MQVNMCAKTISTTVEKPVSELLPLQLTIVDNNEYAVSQYLEFWKSLILNATTLIDISS